MIYTIIKELFELLNPSQRRKLFYLQLLLVVTSFTEIIGIASIGPFMALIGDSTILESENMMSKAYLYFNFSSKEDFIFFTGLTVLMLLTLSTAVSIFTTWLLTMFGVKVGASLASDLYRYYLNQSWLFHVNNTSAELTKRITIETERVTSGIIMRILQINSKIFFSFFMVLAMIIYNPFIAIIGASIFLVAYWLIYQMVKVKLQQFGRNITNESSMRFKLINEGLGGIKDILLLGKQNYFAKQFNESSDNLAFSSGMNMVITALPRYFMELVTFGTIIILVLYLVTLHEGNLGSILSLLSVYALASLKLIPAFQAIYSSLTTIKGNYSGFESIKNDLKMSRNKNYEKLNLKKDKKFKMKKNIVFHNISYKYPNTKEYVLKDLNCLISANTTVGIVGGSGSGKSTFIDIVMGLIRVSKGHIEIDNSILEDKDLSSWQKNIGYVAQSIFLSENTIAENVAWGVNIGDIDLDKVNNAIKLSHLDEFIKKSPEGIYTKVGERGVQLSGGQRQRIGIARALYNNPDILIFDEATSALDSITEKIIMDAINDFSGKKTIIMIAHRLTTVEKCDEIFFIDKGNVIDRGSYQELLTRNITFRAMALSNKEDN